MNELSKIGQGDSQDSAIEVLAPTALESMQRAEIDVQIATARKYPRSMTLFKKRAVEMATIDEETAMSCLYSRPVGGGKTVEGLSVRLAEIVGASYGNLRVGAMIVEMTERFVKCRGIAHDLETNFLSTSEVIESTIDKNGNPFSERMRIVVAKACLAKARRDATFQVCPKALCRPIENAVKALLSGNAQSMTEKRTKAMDWIRTLNIEPKRVFAALGVQGAGDMGFEQLTTLAGLRTGLQDREITVEEAFPPIIAAGGVGATSAAPVGNGGTVTERAAAEKAATPAGPNAGELLKEILKRGGEINAGKVKIHKALVALGTIKTNDTLDAMPAEKLAGVLEGWEAVVAKIQEA